MISINDLSISFSGKDLFNNVSFQIDKSDKIGLVGKNGSGKTTLLRLIIGEMSYDTGIISLPKDIKIGYLPQNLNYNEGKTVMEETLTAFDEFKNLKIELENANAELTERTDFESDSYKKLIDKVSDLSYKLSFQNENTIQAEAEQVLKGLGFVQADFDRSTSEFSGGWRMRVEIAKLLLKKPDVFLLDEPTNHLDIESIQWIENFLADFKGAIVLISHDRRFLDKVTSRTLEISLGKIYDYNVSYSKYKFLRAERRQQEIAAYDNQQSKIKQTERFIERFRAKATKSVQVQSRIKMLDKIDRIEIEPEDKQTIIFNFPPAPRAGDIVLETESLTKNYGNHTVIKNIDFILNRGEKIAFVGKNGEGKTTLARIFNKELDYEGNLKIGHNVSIGYFAQNQDETLDKTITVFDTLDHIAVGDIRTQLRKILGSFLFSNDDIEKKVGVLSGGERARLALAKLILQPYSLLILDEPTNHLDIPAKDILKQALLKYDGTLLIVSHDRDFLEGLVDTVYEFRNQKIKQYKGDINYFLEKKKIENIDQLNIVRKIKETTEKIDSVNKEDYVQRKERKRQLAKIQRQIEKIEGEIEDFEKKIEEIEDKLANPAGNQNHDFFEDYEIIKKSLEDKMSEWEVLQMQIEDFEDID
ncbi:MAG: ABC-F family ATP-binding cassette domain-containing protein [Bacteroidales bacterium]|nr:ABC-F family ATP-binding cassette domain-containing protein [Bacteroidales bacterium]